MTSMKYSVYAASLMAEGGGEVGDKQYRAWRGGGTAAIMESWRGVGGLKFLLECDVGRELSHEVTNRHVSLEI